MKRIIISLLVMVGAVTVITLGSTGAFFSDIETSTGNTFAAGAVDLKIDNHSYYNGVLNASTTWELKDLTIEKFFDFPDLKPGDTGEDTISLHVNDNNAYLCANVKLTSNDDNNQTEPESLVDGNGTTTGELAGNVNFLWWADDGDNVLESTETVISQGPIGALGLQGSTTITLADSEHNIWTGVGGPVPGAQTQYIGKAWCFGTIAPSPLTQDGLGSTSPRTPANSTGGITCDGGALGNETQTDSLTADVTFSAIQSRNNPGFLCKPPETQATSSLTVIKVVTNNNGGNNIITDFHLFVDDGSVSTGVVSGVPQILPPGTYDVSETGVSGYVASYSGDCSAEGNITLVPGDVKVCTITNDDLPGNITLTKVVTGIAPLDDPSSFKLRVDGALVPNTTSKAVSANTSHIITEDAKAGYSFVSITGSAKCPAVLGGTATLDEGEAISCTITNAKN